MSRLRGRGCQSARLEKRAILHAGPRAIDAHSAELNANAKKSINTDNKSFHPKNKRYFDHTSQKELTLTQGAPIKQASSNFEVTQSAKLF